MPSPFPGMDPWLEAPGVFPDFHNRLVNALSEAINALLPPPFFTAIATRVYMEESERQVDPDVDVLRPVEFDPLAPRSTATATIAVRDLLEVPKAPIPNEETTETYLEIRTASNREQLITSIEVLSASNKTRGKAGRGLYLAKQLELTSSGVNLVEIDFLRSGAHATAVSLGELRRRAGRFDYHVCITTTESEIGSFVAPFMLQQALPVIPIPLTEDTPAIAANLQAIFGRTYDAALYHRRIRYSEPCEPPLTPEQQVWADKVLRDNKVLH